MKTNFECLIEHDPVLLQAGSAAESAFPGNPNTTLIKLRQLAEALAQNLATTTSLMFDETTSQSGRINRSKVHAKLSAFDMWNASNIDSRHALLMVMIWQEQNHFQWHRK